MSKIEKKYSLIRYIIDAFTIVLAYFLTALFIKPTNIHIFLHDFLIILLAVFVWYISSVFSKLYHDRRSNKFSEEIIFILYTVIIFYIFISSIFFILQSALYVSPRFLLYFIVCMALLVTTTKYIIRKYVHSAIFQGKLFDSVLIVGVNPASIDFYEAIKKYYYYGYKCIGFLDNQTTSMNGCPYKGNIGQLESLLNTMVVDTVIISLPNSKSYQVDECIEICDAYAIKAKILPDIQHYVSSPININNIGMVSVFNLNQLPLDKIENKILKRSFDIFLSLFFFIFIGSWLLPLIAIIIKLTSKGPVFFKQERWGLNNKRINCYKFRSMYEQVSEVDEKGRYRQAIPNDPRVTKFGKLLRKTNLDELPQFWNVLLGNMSVVGPRPHPTPLNIQSMHSIDNYMQRHKVLPGITGWAQVNGYRGETRTPGSMQKRIDLDLYYIHRWAFWLDCQIILQTVINFFRGDQNAY